MPHSSIRPTGRCRALACAVAVALSSGAMPGHAQLAPPADTTNAAVPTEAVADRAPEAPAEAGAAVAQPDVAAAAAPVPAPSADAPRIVTRVVFARDGQKQGIERLHVVRRQNTMNNVAGQVALNVALLALGVGAAGAGFSKTDLLGDDIPELANDPVAVNPGLDDLRDALSVIATRVYAERAAKAQADARTDGSTPEEIKAAGEVPDTLDTPLHPRAWQLVYENLSTDDGLYRLRFSAEMGRAGFMRPPMLCAYESEPLSWAAWRSQNWQPLREARSKAVAHCTEVLGAFAKKRW